jgi:large subunit ribosomal protein L15
VLAEAGLLRGGNERPIALLGRGKIKRALTIKVHRASKSAVAKVEAAGGTVEILE